MPKKINGNGHTTTGRPRPGASAVLDPPSAALHDAAGYFLMVASPIFVLDTDHTIIDLNPAAISLTGVSKERAIGAKYWDLIDNPACRNGQCAAAQALRTGKTAAALAKGRINGRDVALQVTCAPVFEDGEAIGVIQTVTDNSEEERLEKELLGVVARIRAGELDKRTSSDGFSETSARILKGVDELLDAVTAPVHVAATYVDRIAKGDIPEKITAAYNGDFNTLKNNLNGCIDNIQGLITEMVRMSDEHNKGDIDATIPAQNFQGAYRVMAQGVNDMVAGHISVKRKAMACVAEFGKGNFEAELERFPGKKVFINNTIEEVRRSLKALVGDMNALSRAAVEGKLITRADASQHLGDFRKIVLGVNETLDAVIGPLNVAANYVDRIAKGDIPTKITDQYNGDFNTIKLNLNACVDNINALVTDAGVLVNAAVDGKLATRADATKHQGDFRRIVEGVNQTLDAVIGPLNVAADYVDKISKGVIPAKITDPYNGDFNLLKANLNTCIDSLNGLITQMGRMSDEHNKGDIDITIPAENFQGAYRVMAQGVNDMVAGHITVKKKAMACLAEFGKGNFEAPLEQFPGKKAFINRTTEEVRANLKALIADTGVLVKAAVEGKLATRADAAKHQGDFRKIVDGVNQTLDAVIGPLNVAATYVDRISRGDIPQKITDQYNGDFNSIKHNLNVCIDSISALVTDATTLAKAAVEGQLSTRADATRHQGEYRKIVEGVNGTLDAVMAPINEAAQVLERVATQDLTATVTGAYKGDHAAIKGNINKMTQDLRESIKQIALNSSTLSSSAEELTAVSQQMAGNAEETATQANVVSAASEQVSHNVTTVSSAAEQMQSSIREIAKNANEAARVAKNAVLVAQTTNETMTKLGVSSAEIGNVIKVITSIAQQTNLLALNATIEAARAGEAGKGFAVVANEVKELAKQTAKATEEISKKIEAIQGDTGGAVKAIEEISGIINQINDISNSIASAVEEQTVTTNEIGKSVTEAARGTGDIAKNISGVALAAKETTRGANDTRRAAEELSRMASQLQAIVSRFTI